MHHRTVAARRAVAFVITSALLLGSTFAVSPAEAANPQSARYARGTDGIFWFMHITDTHIAEVGTGPEKNLRFALGEAFQVIRPVAVFNTGDLCEGARDKAPLVGLPIPTSGVNPKDWEKYSKIMVDMKVDPTIYFDVPGNHDTYDDEGLFHYLTYSLQGSVTETALFAEKVHTTSLGNYYFVATNGSGTWGKPISFGNPRFTHVAELEAGLAENADAQLVFVFAHQHLVPHEATDVQVALGIGGTDDPPVNASEVLPLLEDAGAFYLHGHVHQYKEGLQGNVVTMQLGALKSDPTSIDRSTPETWEKTKYRSNMGIGIVDHNAFIYGVTDTVNPWPFVAITAPVDVSLKGGGIPAGNIKVLGVTVDYPGDALAYGEQENPYAYPVCLDRPNNPVRAVVLSNGTIGTVKVSLDSTEMGTMTPAAEPEGVFEGTINTIGKSPGFHVITVTAQAGGKTRSDSIRVRFVPGPCECEDALECPSQNECLAGLCRALPVCEVDAECESDRECSDGVCVPRPSCETPSQCAADRECVGGVCVPVVEPVCKKDGDCKTGEVCTNGECVPAKPECVKSADCLGDEVCLDGQCTAVCKDDSECDETEECVAGGCNPRPVCTEDAECPDGVCADGVCMKEVVNDSSGGCSCSVGSSNTREPMSGLAAMLLGLGAVAYRKRRGVHQGD